MRRGFFPLPLLHPLLAVACDNVSLVLAAAAHGAGGGVVVAVRGGLAPVAQLIHVHRGGDVQRVVQHKQLARRLHAVHGGHHLVLRHVRSHQRVERREHVYRVAATVLGVVGQAR